MSPDECAARLAALIEADLRVGQILDRLAEAHEATEQSLRRLHL